MERLIYTLSACSEVASDWKLQFGVGVFLKANRESKTVLALEWGTGSLMPFRNQSNNEDVKMTYLGTNQL